jgi:hypothetical protein
VQIYDAATVTLAVPEPTSLCLLLADLLVLARVRF